MTPERLRVLVLLISGVIAAAFLGILGYAVLQPPPSAAPAPVSSAAGVTGVNSPPRSDVTGVTSATAGARVAVKGGKKQRPWVADAFEKRRPGALAALARTARHACATCAATTSSLAPGGPRRGARLLEQFQQRISSLSFLWVASAALKTKASHHGASRAQQFRELVRRV